MRIFPSIPASIVTGVVIIPTFITGMRAIHLTLNPGVILVAVQLLWGIAAFFIPFLFSTMDMRYVRQRQRQLGGNIFTPLASRQDFAELYVPAWVRMGVVMCSAGVSLLVLKRLGMDLL